MNSLIRPYAETDLNALVDLALLAFEPVFRSFHQLLGPGIYSILYPDWQQRQREGIETTCRDNTKAHVLVAEVDSMAIGFLAYELRDTTGEVLLLAVHPAYQNHGVGTELNLAALQAMKHAGIKLVEVGTGGDESHAPARRSYEKAGYTALPLVRYYKDL